MRKDKGIRREEEMKFNDEECEADADDVRSVAGTFTVLASVAVISVLSLIWGLAKLF
jgi:hypothetical protein